MASSRKNQGISNSQVGHRRSSSYYGKPPLGNRFSTVPLSEKKFWAMVDSVPWDEGKRYMESHSKVMKWDDFAVKQAVYEAKFRYNAEINGYRCDIALPDPDMYIDDVDWDASVDPQLCLDLDREDEARRKMIEKSEQETLIMGIEEIVPTGWGDDEEQVRKPEEPSYAADGWGSTNHENNEINSWEEDDSHRWIPNEQYGGDLHDKYQASNGWNKNWRAWEGNNRRRDNNRERRNGGRGGRRGNYTHAAKVAATPRAW